MAAQYMFFGQLPQEQGTTSSTSFVSLLTSFQNAKGWEEGEHIHAKQNTTILCSTIVRK